MTLKEASRKENENKVWKNKVWINVYPELGGKTMTPKFSISHNVDNKEKEFFL